MERSAALSAYRTLGCESKDGMFVTSFKLFTRVASASGTHFASVDLFSGPAELRDESVWERPIEELRCWEAPGVHGEPHPMFAPAHPERQADIVGKVAAYLGGQLGKERKEWNGMLVNATSLTVERLPAGDDELRPELFFYSNKIHEPALVHRLEGAELDLAKQFDSERESP